MDNGDRLKRATELLMHLAAWDGPLEAESRALRHNSSPTSDIDKAHELAHEAVMSLFAAIGYNMFGGTWPGLDEPHERAYNLGAGACSRVTATYRPRKRYTPRPQTASMAQVVTDLREAMCLIYEALPLVPARYDDIPEDDPLQGELVRAVREEEHNRVVQSLDALTARFTLESAAA
ncbi:hypothetical protein ABT213_06160 [Streptomyces sp. NPDC001674]|uniref:hypothetical protein n=1 Tax=Streptomyces sp. NPDC001674 TaxID=3154394 RepID=UPI00332440CA